MSEVWTVLCAAVVPESQSPSLVAQIFRFFFGWIFLLWFAIVVLAVISVPFARFFGMLRERRKLIRSEGAKFANPQNAEARYRLAAICFRGHRYRKAEGLVREALEIAGKSPVYKSVPHRFHVLLGDVHFRRKRYGEAVEAYERALAAPSDMGYGDVYLGLGRCSLRAGEPEKALEWLEKSLKERTSYLETYFRIAQAAAVLGRKDRIREARRQFSETAANIPRFARQKKFRWRLAFWFFPFFRHLI
ncbi:MAG: tetratricopeptide repeat protein [Planctomycetota bacterium]|jgi:tetratricopeptide (TPR) repeat protein